MTRKCGGGKNTLEPMKKEGKDEGGKDEERKGEGR